MLEKAFGHWAEVRKVAGQNLLLRHHAVLEKLLTIVQEQVLSAPKSVYALLIGL